jgi:cardiolipin synthase
VATPTNFTLFTEGDALYDAMLASIEAARRSIWLESYIFADDEVGRRFADTLGAAAGRGVDVRLHIDAAGSLFWFSRRLERGLARDGVRVRWFHRWQWREPWRYGRRNHRKLLVIDGSEVYLGGFNIHRQSSRRHFGDERWRDTHVRMHGPLAADGAALFDAFWKGKRRWHPMYNPDGDGALLTSHSREGRFTLRRFYSTLIDSARDTLYLTTPYFVPDNFTQDGLIHAAKRGLDARLLVPGKSDVRLARWAARASYAKLLDAGVRIFEYRPRVLHAKTAVADGAWATIGTANLDYRSLFLNYELNLVTRDRDLCAELTAQFHADLANSIEVEHGRWDDRPWTEHLSEAVGWAARRWL